LKYEGQRGSGYLSPAAAPARGAAFADPSRALSARLHAAATITVARKMAVSSLMAFEAVVIA
jgi:hypothetical protein